LENDIRYRIGDDKDKVVAFDALLYIIFAAGLIDHKLRMVLLEMTTTIFKAYITMTIKLPGYIYKEIESMMRMIIDTSLTKTAKETLEKNITKYNMRDLKLKSIIRLLIKR
jgi:hypothetical protein